MLKWNKHCVFLAVLWFSFVSQSFAQSDRDILNKIIKVDSTGIQVDSISSVATMIKAAADTVEIGPGVARDSWEVIRNPEWEYKLESVFFVDPNNGWAAGTDGTIIHTNDGGTNWTSQVSGTSNHLYSVHFVNSSTGWVVGDEGTVLRTTDSGTSWEATASGTTNHLRDIFFINTTHGWAVGGKITVSCCPLRNLRHTNVVLRTENGGESWSKSTSLGSRRLLHSVHFADAQHGWAVGYGYALLSPYDMVDRNIVLRSTNGGATWSSQSVNPMDHLFAVHAVDQSTGWITGDKGTLLYSNNGGIDWSEKASNTSHMLRALHFVNAEQGWIVGKDGLILYTEDGGNNWITQTSGTTNGLEDVFFVDDSTGWAVGDAGIVLKYTVSTAQPPVANFTGSPRSGTAPLTVQFTDKSTGTITSRSWDFGDGQTSTSTNPSHTYQNAGTYTVKLKVTGPGGSDTKTRSNYITVTDCFWADIDCDRDVDVVDIQIVAGKWNTKVGDPNYDPICDVDNEGQGDGDIDVVDIQLVAGWWNKPIPPGNGSSTIAKTSKDVPENVILRVHSPAPGSESAGSYHVDVMIENAVNLGAFQFDVVSKDKGSKIEGVELGRLLKNSRNTVISLGPEIDTERNKLTFGAFSYGGSSGISGSGVLARIRLTSPSNGVLPIELDSVKVTDTNGNLMQINRIVYADFAEAALSTVPSSFSLSQNYPNPFNPTTRITFNIPDVDGGPVRVRLHIYGLKGQLVRKLVDKEKSPGSYSVQWDGRDDRGRKMASGIYFYSISAGDFTATLKMILVE